MATSPSAGSQRSLTLTRSQLLDLASAQRIMMWLFIFKLGLDFTFNSMRFLMSPTGQTIYLSIYFVVCLVISYFVCRVANVLHGLLPGVICALLVLVPFLGTLTILVLNGSAQDTLRKAGIKGGYFGVSPAQLAELQKPAEPADLDAESSG